VRPAETAVSPKGRAERCAGPAPTHLAEPVTSGRAASWSRPWLWPSRCWWCCSLPCPIGPGHPGAHPDPTGGNHAVAVAASVSATPARSPVVPSVRPHRSLGAI